MPKRPIILLNGLTNTFTISKGLAKAVSPEERVDSKGEPVKHYQWLETGDRDWDTAMRERITLPMAHGLLLTRKPDGTVKFDDRKLRYAGHTVSADGTVNFQVAPTHFGELLATNNRIIGNPEYEEQMRMRGITKEGDDQAYFANAFAANAVPVTEDGVAHVFKRGTGTKVLPGYWHVIGGMFDPDLEIFDKPTPSTQFRKAVRAGIEREFEEEAATGGIRFELTGLSNGYAAIDFTHVAYIPGTSNEFLDRMETATDREHVDARGLRNPAAIEAFLNTEEKIVPNGYASLQLYLAQLARK